ncbi:MAG TPA: dienelactone hydrolase family protein [Acidimicrobiales bacterium]|nr:dienelactone hydrolase family protein [Acidimicrobiales bacterium]
MRRSPTLPMLICALVMVGCSGGDDAATPDSSSPPTIDTATTTVPTDRGGTDGTPSGPLAFTGAGPYPVGTLEIDAPNGPVTVWYPGEPGSEAGLAPATYDLRTYLPPADQAKVASAEGVVHTMDAYADLPGAEPLGAPFPLVLFSHGFCGYRQQSSFLTTTIASWGFVVAAPEHRARDLTSCLTGTIGQGASTDVEDLRATIPVMEGANLRDEGPLATIVDTSRVAIVGHSAGGGAAIQMSADPAVTGIVALAAGHGPPPPAKPALYVAGESDVIAPAASIEQWWNASVPSPKQLAVLGGVSHLGFMDACAIAADEGGIFQIAMDAGIAVPEVVSGLYTEGCAPEHTPAQAAWPAIRHLTVAQLRAAFGIDPVPVGLDASVSDAYEGLSVRLETA